MNAHDASKIACAIAPNDAGAPSLEQAHAVLAFWRDIGKDGWFEKNDAVDARFRECFLELHFAAAARRCETWLDDAVGGLAVLLLLDQFPRNAFRGTAHMFATDPLARHYARRYIDSGLINAIDSDLRLFACLPFAHSEDLHDQRYAGELYARYAPDSLQWAENHKGIIERFGRFPHRNNSLGRQTTAAERSFLEAGGFAG